MYEACVVCKNLTDVLETVDVGARCFYVDGAGQLCSVCHTRLID